MVIRVLDVSGAGNELRKVFLMYTPVVVVGAVLVLLFSELVVGAVAPAYLPGVFVVKVLNVSGLVLGYLWILSNYYNGLGKVKKSVWSIVIYNALLLIISFWIM